MAKSLHLNISGLPELNAKLKALPAELAKQVLTPALQAGAEVIAAELRARTPVRTGLLQKNVGFQVHISPNGRAGYAVIGFRNQGFKARMVEFGHRLLSHGKKSQREEIGHVLPHPFIRPAFDASKAAAAEAVVAKLRDGLTGISK